LIFKIFPLFINDYKNYINSEPRQRAFLFLVLPSKKDYPFYYQIITKPIAMDTIKKRIKTNYYKSVKQFRDDWNLMFNNARTFNEEGSQVFIDADKMQVCIH
jgi:ATP-dependent helicase STH1/SNF2